jgi:hypothetical protein
MFTGCDIIWVRRATNISETSDASSFRNSTTLLEAGNLSATLATTYMIKNYMIYLTAFG